MTFYRVVRAVVVALCRVLFRVKVYGLENELSAKFGENLARFLASGGNHVAGERAQLDAMLAGERDKRFGVEALHFREREIRFDRGRVRDDCPGFGVERLPKLQRDDAFPGAVRLVESGPVVKRRDAIETERNVGAGPDKFRAVDDAGLQTCQHFRGRSRLRGCAHPAEDFAAEPERAERKRQ